MHKILAFLSILTLCSFASAQESGRIFGTGYAIVDSSKTIGQEMTIRLKSIDTNGKPLSVEFQQTITDRYGKYAFNNLPFGRYSVEALYIGFHNQLQEVQLSKENPSVELDFLMQPELIEMVTVDIVAKSSTQRAKELAVRAVVVDVANFANQPTTITELMNRSTGIRMRQSGGLGNAVDISINGFQGNSVQYFKDGIPLEYLGGGYGINNVPVNLLERVEVFKGVVPVSLGGDALGGAINMVTKTNQKSYLNASYEVASFNTHIAQLSAYQTVNRNYFLGFDAFYNYSDNDYKADVQVVNEQANLVDVRVPLFHNWYKQHFVEAFVGIKNTSWADELKVSLAQYQIDRASQHPALMTNPYGALTTQNKGIIPSFRYRKGIMDNRLMLDQFVSYSAIERSRTDTVMGTYDWFGNFKPSNSMGESPRRSLAQIDFDNLMSRTNAKLFIRPGHRLEANLVLNRNSRVGSDPYGLRFNGTDIDVLSKKATYHKTIAGLTYESTWLRNQLTNQTTVKYFHYMAEGINGFMANATDLDQFTKTSNTNFGIGTAFKYNLNARSFVRASAELTNRLPKENELFGDSDTRAPNFQLEPERSFNVNVGYSLNTEKWTFEVGTFYRKTKGMILLVPVQPPFAQYQNLDSIRGYGFDIDAQYQINKQYSIQGNVTWQDNRMVDIPDGLYKWIEGTRLRNTPYFFSNASANAKFENVLQGGDQLKGYIHWNYIREFYLNHIPRDKEPQGFLGLWGNAGVPITNVVPDQHLWNAGFTYFLAKQPLSLGVEVKNVMDTKLYDYYKIQRPGRSFHVKLSYTLNSK